MEETMSVLERVKDAAETLTPAEQLLIKQVIASPRDIALGTASGLARRIGVHEATASRLAKKLGYPNYAGFRAAIQEEFIVRTDPATRVRNTLQQTSEAGLITDLVSREIEALAGLQRYVDDAKLLAAAQALLKARRIYVFARGNAEAQKTCDQHRRVPVRTFGCRFPDACRGPRDSIGDYRPVTENHGVFLFLRHSNTTQSTSAVAVSPQVAARARP